MSDITFSMTADDKDVIRALQNSGKEFGKLRDQIMSLATASNEQGKAEANLSQQRLAALAPIIAKQKELRAVMDDLGKQLKDGKISQDQYNAAVKSNADASDQLTQELRKLQAVVQEDTDDLRKAAVIIGQVEDKTGKYTRTVAELDRMKAKSILTSKQHAAAIEAERKKLEDIGDGAEKSGGLIGGLTGKMGQFVAGLAGGSAIISTIRQEYDLLIERQGKSKDANLQLGVVTEGLINNGADANVLAKVRDLAKSRGINEATIGEAVSATLSARGDFAISDVTDAVGSVSKVKRLGGASEMAGLSAAVLDTRKQTGLGTDQSLGFIFQMQDLARTKSLNDLATNLTPAIGGVMKMGTDRQTSGALLAALSHGMGDATGANTATAGLSLADQLRKFAPGQDLGQTIASLQGDAKLRDQFFAGASFEVKARPAIEGLLSGGKEAKDFAAFRQSLNADPTQRLRTAEENRGAAQSIAIAEESQRALASANRGQLKDTTGARSAISRESIREMRLQAGRLGVSSTVLGMFDDVRTGGIQTVDTQAQAIQAEIARLEAGKTDGSALANAGASALLGGPLTGMFVEQAMTSRNRDSEGNKEQIKILQAMLDELKAQSAELQGQTGNQHAGVVAGRRLNQMEGAAQ